MKNQPIEFWVNVFGMDQNKAYGMCHTNLKDAEYSLKSDMLAYRIHVKMKPVKPMPYKPITKRLSKSDKNDLWY